MNPIFTIAKSIVSTNNCLMSIRRRKRKVQNDENHMQLSLGAVNLRGRRFILLAKILKFGFKNPEYSGHDQRG